MRTRRHAEHPEALERRVRDLLYPRPRSVVALPAGRRKVVPLFGREVRR